MNACQPCLQTFPCFLPKFDTHHQPSPSRVMREVGKNLDIPLHVFGPETHMTAIVGMALGKREIPVAAAAADTTTANFLLPSSVSYCSR